MDTGLLAGAIGLGLIVLCTVVSTVILGSSLLKIKKTGLPLVYEDKDGASTQNLTAKFSSKLPKTVITLSSLLGLATSVAIAVLSTLDIAEDGLFLEDWLNAAAWVRAKFSLKELQLTLHV
jgi:hypothetical protein